MNAEAEEKQMSEQRKRPVSPDPEEQRKRSKSSMPTTLQLTLVDLWRQWAQPLKLAEHNWKFSSLEAAFKKGGVLHGENKVFLFCCADPPLPLFTSDGPAKACCWVPTVVAIVSSVAPSHKVVIRTRTEEQVIDMEKMNLAWLPFIPLGEGGSSLESPLPEIYVINHLKNGSTCESFEFDPMSHNCLPYFENPYKAIDERKQSSTVDIEFEGDTGTIVTKFNWRNQGIKGITSLLVGEGKLSVDNTDAFKEFVISKVKEKERANLEEIQKRNQYLEELRRTKGEEVAVYDKMRFYKFYPVAIPNTADLSFSGAKTPLINFYYGKAHQVV